MGTNKLEVHGFTVKYSTRKKKSQNNKLIVLERKLKRLEQEIVKEDRHREGLFSKEETEKEIIAVKTEIDKIVEYKTNGAMIRTRRNYIAYGEKNNSYFFNLEKHNYMSKNRYKLKDDDGSIVTDPGKILDIQTKFYRNLYMSAEVSIKEGYLEHIKVNKLTNEQREDLEQVISIVEIRKAIFDLNREKNTRK